MAVLKADESTADDLGLDRDGFCPHNFRHFLEHRCSDDRQRAIHLDERVLLARVDGDGEIRGQCPGRSRPDHERGRALALAGEGAIDRLAVGGLEVHIDRGIDAILVLKFRLGERGAIGDRPMHWLQLPEDKTLIEQRREHLERPRLVLGLHREVWMVVVGERQESLHLFRLRLDEFLGVRRAFAADRHTTIVVRKRVELCGLAAFDESSHDTMLDGQTVTVPTWDIVAALALHDRRTHDEILENLVEQVPDMNRAVGIGRSVVEDELGGPCARRGDGVPTSVFCQRAKVAGSACARFAFIGNEVLGRFSVAL